MQQKEYKAAEQTRILWLGVIMIGLILELIGAVLLFRGRGTEGLISAVAGLLVWLTARFVGMRQYTRACAQMRTSTGMGLKDATDLDGKAVRDELPWEAFLPPHATPDRPLMVFTRRGRWHGFNTTLTELTVGYRTRLGSREYISGTLAVVEADCKVPGLLAIYGQPYGGVPLSQWEDMQPADTGGRGYLLLCSGQAPDEHALDALGRFDPDDQKMAVLRTEEKRTAVFLPRQFYSGTWTITKPMPESAVRDDPLPALDELPKLIRSLA